MSCSGGRRRQPCALGAAVVVLIAAAFAPACESDAEEQSAVEAFCAGLCSAVDRCQPGDGSCNARCTDTSSAGRFSRLGAKLVGECVSSIDCGTLADDAGWKDVFDACWESAKPVVPVTAHVRSVCAAYEDAWFECGSPISTHECELNLGMWSDAVLDQVAACVPIRDCTDFDACVGRVFEAL